MDPFPKQKLLNDFFKPTSSSQLKQKPELKSLPIILPVPGLRLIKNFITEAEETFLWQEVNKLPWNTDIKRRHQVHGYRYDPQTKSQLIRVEELPICFSTICDKIMEEKLMAERPDSCVVNEYEPGQGIHPHIDSTIFGDEVINVSLGSDIVIDFYDPQEQKKSVLLPRRSALVVEGDSRYKWKHGIALRKTDKLDGGMVLKRNKRISLTFRTARKELLKKE